MTDTDVSGTLPSELGSLSDMRYIELDNELKLGIKYHDNTTSAWHSLEGNERIYGNVGNENLEGGAGDDTLYGGPGDDTLDGLRGDDILYGGPGDDIIDGTNAHGHERNMGLDTLYGNEGADTFVLRSGSDYVTISDFDPGTDLIQLRSMRFDELDITKMGNSTQITINTKHLRSEWQVDGNPDDLLAILPGIEPEQLAAGDFV